jgi:hypothetical protein
VEFGESEVPNAARRSPPSIVSLLVALAGLFHCNFVGLAANWPNGVDKSENNTPITCQNNTKVSQTAVDIICPSNVEV